ncbi:MAG: molybdopterin-synthase adenylyltransferase MoeB [Planctomycetes bacterium]|nr:molybdopterin-synthase adenylyltransferase MoeB [Planctomycetota bacterium]
MSTTSPTTLAPSIPDFLGSRTDSVSLSSNEVARYSRHLIMPEVGVDGQKRLKASSILLIGAGGLGSPLGLYLAAAGVGRLGIVDFDVVDFSNLQRQIMHGTADVGRPKLDSARDRIAAINPEVRVDLYNEHLTSANVMRIFEPYDIIIDGTDNFPTRYLVNDACVLLKKPNVYGSIFRFDGQASVFHPPYGPCYRCLYPEPPPPGEVPSCAEGGVLGILPGIIGVIQATEAIKMILGKGEPLVGRLLHFDALAMKFREFKVRRNPKCPMCGDNPTIKALIDYEQFCGIRGQEAPAPKTTSTEITVEQLKKRMDSGEKLFVLDVRNLNEFQICRIPGTTLLPLPELPQRIGEVPRDREIIVHCKSGMRSAKAAQFLKEQGYKNVVNLQGGILAWSERVDPNVPKY